MENNNEKNGGTTLCKSFAYIMRQCIENTGGGKITLNDYVLEENCNSLQPPVCTDHSDGTSTITLSKIVTTTHSPQHSTHANYAKTIQLSPQTKFATQSKIYGPGLHMMATHFKLVTHDEPGWSTQIQESIDTNGCLMHHTNPEHQPAQPR